jgi:hypothetical protein
MTQATDNIAPILPPNGNKRFVELETLLAAQHMFMPTSL